MCLIESDNIKVAEENLRVFKIFASEPIGVFPEAEGVDKLKTLWRIPPFKRRLYIEEILSNHAVGFDNGFGYSCFRDKRQAQLYEEALPAYVVVKELRIPKGSRYRIGKIVQGELGTGLTMCQAERLMGVGG